MTGEHVATGDELLTGVTVDSNGAFAASTLREVGVALGRMTVVGDGLEEIEAAVRAAAGRSRVVIVSGGLGPTADDLTTEAVARAAGTRLERRPAALEHVRRLFASRGVAMAPNNEKQADLPVGAEILDNPVGTAVGFVVRIGGADVFCLPGVPGEYRRMLAEQVAPRVARISGVRLPVRVLRCYGTGESRLAHDLRDVVWPASVRIGYRAMFPEVQVRIYGQPSAEGDLDDAEARARACLGARVFAAGDKTMMGVIGDLLLAKGWRLAVAESCTGGLLAGALTDEPGASRWLGHGFVACVDRALEEMLGVESRILSAHGAVSAQAARAMACGASKHSGADVAVSVAGRLEGVVHLGIVAPGVTHVVKREFPGGPERERRLAVWSAMDLVRRVLSGLPVDD